MRYALQGLICFLLLFAAATAGLGIAAKGLQYIIADAVAALTLALLAFLQQREPQVRESWSYLSPSALEWFALASSLAFTVLFLFLYYSFHYFVGPARADADTQMFALELLIAGFAAGTGFVFLVSFAGEVRWNGDCIEQRRPLRATKKIVFTDIVAGGLNRWTHAIWIAAANGTVIRFSSYANGAETLTQAISRIRGQRLA